jgi:sialidase-1
MKAKLVNVGRVQGIRGQALSFSGSGSYFDYGDSPRLSFNAKAPFTMAFWVQTRNSKGTRLSHRHSRDGSPVIDILITNSRVSAQVRKDGNEFDLPVQIDGRTINDGAWHHVALTRDGDTLELFLDSVSQGQKSGTAAGGAITTNLRALGSERYWIDRKSAHGDPNFKGSMDEFCIFGRALNAEEITTLAGR